MGGGKGRVSNFKLVLGCLLCSTIVLCVFLRGLYDFERKTSSHSPKMAAFPASTQISESGRLDTRRVAKILLLAYQRTGSTFVGKFFDLNPQAFYSFEPLDAAYVALYGTQEGWNIPTDIRTFPNGSRRFIPSVEIRFLTNHLFDLFNCNFDKMTPGFIGHKYWYVPTFSTGARSYQKCLPKQLKSECDELHPCHSRLGENWTETNKCHMMLQEPANTNPRIKKYRKCMDAKRKQLEQCLPALLNTCLSAELRVAKTVRASFHLVESMLTMDPDLFLIHLYRDPVSVAVSRLKHWSVRGLVSKKNGTIAEARAYCNDLTEDIRMREQLKKSFPTRIINLYYDELVQNPLYYARQIYSKFVKSDLPSDVIKMLNRTSKHGAVKSKKLPTKTKAKIAGVCSEFYGMLPPHP